MTDCTCGGDGVRYTLGAQHDCPIHGFPKRTSPHPSPGKALAEGARLSEEEFEVHSGRESDCERCRSANEDGLSEGERRTLNYSIPPGGPVIREQVHAAVERVVAARVAEAERRVLREAADDMCQCTADWLTAYEQHMKDCPARWLHDRAARLAADASPGGEG